VGPLFFVETIIVEYYLKLLTQFIFRILDAASRIKKREEQFRRKTRHFCTGVAKCIVVDSGIFKRLL
jgi:hypothetical protein